MNKLVVYGKPDCSQCVELVQKLKADAIPYEYKTLGEDFTREDLVEIKPPQVRTFPVPFIVDEDDNIVRYIKPQDVNVLDEDIARLVIDF